MVTSYANDYPPTVGVQASVQPGGENQDYWQHLHGGSWSHPSSGRYLSRGDISSDISRGTF